MVTLVVKRIGFMIFTMIIVSLILFLLLETDLTGDPATRVLGQFSNEEQRELWRELRGLDPAGVFVVDIDADRAAAVAHEVGARGTTDLSAALREVSAVIIAAPTTSEKRPAKLMITPPGKTSASTRPVMSRTSPSSPGAPPSNSVREYSWAVPPISAMAYTMASPTPKPPALCVAA